MDFQSKKSFGKLRLRAFQPYHQILCISKHVEDVEDRSIHLRAVMLCMLKMSKIDQIHLRAVMLCYVCRRCQRCIALNALNTVQKIKAMSKMSKIDQIHLRAVMPCMSETSKMGKEYTHTFWLITSLILNGFSIRKKFWKAETESFPTIPSNSMFVEAC